MVNHTRKDQQRTGLLPFVVGRQQRGGRLKNARRNAPNTCSSNSCGIVCLLLAVALLLMPVFFLVLSDPRVRSLVSAGPGDSQSQPLQHTDVIALVEQRVEDDVSAMVSGAGGTDAAKDLQQPISNALRAARKCDVTLITVYTLRDVQQHGEGFVTNVAQLWTGQLAVCHRLVSAVRQANRLMERFLGDEGARRPGYAISTELTDLGDVFSVLHDVTSSSRSTYFMHWEIEDRKPMNNLVEKVAYARSGGYAVVVSPVEVFFREDALVWEIDADLLMEKFAAGSVEHSGYSKYLALSDLFQYDQGGAIAGMSNVTRTGALFSADAYAILGGIRGRSDIADQCLFAAMKHSHNMSLGFTGGTLEFRSVFRATVKSMSDKRSQLHIMRDDCTAPEEFESHGLFNNEAYRSNDPGLAHPRVAVFHEMLPRSDQGGNIRLRMIFDVLLANGFHVDVFTREPLWIPGSQNMPNPAYTSIDLTYGAFRVFADNHELSTHLHKVSSYDIVISALWFWRDFTVSEVQPIPLLVKRMLHENMHIPHIVISDDVHYERCRHTEKNDEWRLVEPVERSIWSSPDFLKVFITVQDMHHAVHGSRLSQDQAARTMTVLPYMLRPRRVARKAVWHAKGIYDMVYFGNAHPANIQALEALINEAAQESGFSLKLVLHVLGDTRWKAIIDKLKSTKASFFLDVRAEGIVHDLDDFLSGMDLAVLPVTVGGTGVSSKVFKCIETGTPFVSTMEGNRGFKCDSNCEDTFFASSVPELFVKARQMLSSSARYREAISQVTALGESLSQHSLATNTLLQGALHLSSKMTLESHASI